MINEFSSGHQNFLGIQKSLEWIANRKLLWIQKESRNESEWVSGDSDEIVSRRAWKKFYHFQVYRFRHEKKYKKLCQISWKGVFITVVFDVFEEGHSAWIMGVTIYCKAVLQLIFTRKLRFESRKYSLEGKLLLLQWRTEWSTVTDEEYNSMLLLRVFGWQLYAVDPDLLCQKAIRKSTGITKKMVENWQRFATKSPSCHGILLLQLKQVRYGRVVFQKNIKNWRILCRSLDWFGDH